MKCLILIIHCYRPKRNNTANTAAHIPANGTVNTQAPRIGRTIFHCTEFRPPEYIPRKTIAPTWQCVVDTGKPPYEASNTDMHVANWTQNPLSMDIINPWWWFYIDGLYMHMYHFTHFSKSNPVKSCPIVLITFSPYKLTPIATNTAASTSTHAWHHSYQ